MAVAPTTEVIDVDVRPIQYSEHFDTISAENAKEAFRTFVREEVQKHLLFQLTTDPITRAKLQDAIAKEDQAKLIEKQGFQCGSIGLSSEAFCRPRVWWSRRRRRSPGAAKDHSGGVPESRGGS